MKNSANCCIYTKAQTTWLVVLRVFIGWHFLYEGLVKIMNPKWTSMAYLLDSKGPASSFFVGLTQDPSTMNLVNFCNEWGLFLVGLGLLTGCLSKLSSIGGIAFLGIYYLSHPSFVGAGYIMPFEGTYLWIDKNLVELAALIVLLVFPTSKIIGIDRLLVKAMPAGILKLKLI
ncbi:MAG: DoxX family membrane protein [Porphyromonadaceae bacterium]|nr:DoxX family membrane protein [Porphyromonadaceae bacterium]